MQPAQPYDPLTVTSLIPPGATFSYGQGSAFAGFTNAADIDVVAVWDELPTRDATFRSTDYALEKLVVDGQQVDLMHFSLATFTSWVEEVEAGRGWREERWPLPLHVVGGFAAGVLLTGDATDLQRRLQQPTPQFVEAVVESLQADLTPYCEELRTCARRGDHWLFGRLIDRLVRHIYFAWFAQEGHYCPFPKHLSEWITKLDLNRELAELHATVWAAQDLGDRVDAVERLARGVMGLEGGRRRG